MAAKGEHIPGLTETLGVTLASRYFNNLSRVNELAASLTDTQFWQKPFPYGNSFGHLVLHLTGNLNYYIGAQIANTRYVRDRPKEFNDPNPSSKEESLGLLHDAVVMVIKTIGSQSPEDWSKEYWGNGTNATNRLDMILQCSAHMQHHIGQMIYIVYEWERRAGSK